MDATTQDTGRKIAEQLGDWIVATATAEMPATCVEMARKLVLDVVGLGIAARREDYIAATLSTVEARQPGAGSCTAFGHDVALGAYDAALVNGTAAHGEDYDDTFEGGPVHSGAVIVPAMMALCEREGLDGASLLRGILVGTEIQCRLGLVAPKAIHKAGFHPTAVLGALAAAAATAAALRLPLDQVVSGIGIAGSTASGIIEYLADGTWTKRMHAGWAAQAGLRAALMARGGFLGPRSVLEGTHGFFQAFAPSRKPDFTQLLGGLGKDWVMPSIAFKPYACGTMTQPYIDCAIALAARGVAAGDVVDITCKVGEGTVHRLWETLADKHRPATPYAAKFSTPFCMAVGFIDGRAGFEQFTEARIHDPAVLSLAGKISYVIDPDNEYPSNFTGHLRAMLTDGTVHEIDQPHMRGGARQPLATAEVEAKFMDNARYGGWSAAQATKLRDYVSTLFQQNSLAGLAEFRA